ncbi:hypothetical protein Ppa06_15640 [Planomonospora parontospora subsp. parontospora]|uniref:Uncharacterized protein n=2 Tax=Planomonospora parontospora TaxID=58119 RepID=A0AA37BDW4_9ACTN|nr:hypothetical protein [Planomonospora parontospora]GGK57406.1 hypothetical protein GCM10010126_16190 [Planomonospora parontospora]GGL07910.1 hypothetical protein GCM10014719_07480 [Planomonospora parontospora subsp. antibiotica]GII07766.1 hypothetical protein Ppa06_15640 [Planomonospora parontospora subsp. parontospora]GII14597.1 hypothetical protein Ppa05_13230 [Planomonospora parontospora subsp. antibiotica]
MSDPQIDPAGNTQQFRAFAQRKDPEAAPQRRSPIVPIVAGVVVVLVIAAVAAYLIL